MKLLVPELVPFEAQIDGVRVVVFDPTAPIPDAHLDAAALVVWGMPNERIFDAARRLRRLRWVQGLAAGPDNVVAAGFADDVRLDMEAAAGAARCGASGWLWDHGRLHGGVVPCDAARDAGGAGGDDHRS